MIRIDRLVEVLSIPTFYGKENLMREYLVKILNEKNIDNYVDEYGNVYATKGSAEYFPCVVAHIDTVHEITDFEVIEENYSLSAIKPNGEPTGIGGDNKAGVFVCLELLDHFDNIKAAFFVSEEVGCLGSTLSDAEFFNNVGYALQFDAPGNNWVTYYCDGVKLFNKDSDFFDKVRPILEDSLKDFTVDNLGYHPYTDVSALRKLYNFSCLNYSVGYYNMHSVYEFVFINDVDNCLKTAQKLISSLGEQLYYMEKDRDSYKINKKMIAERLERYRK
jgi:putative aminopeptidase FrvX